MTVEQIRAAIEWIRAVMRGLVYEDDGTTLRSMTDEESSSFAEGEAEIERLQGMLAQHERIQALADAGHGIRGDNPQPVSANTRRSEDPFDLSDLRYDTTPSSLRARALDAVERIEHVDDSVREAATRTIERTADPRGELAMRMLVTGSDAYRSAFQKALAGRQYALTSDESAALERAQSLTGNAGGYAVPFTLDPTIILTNDGTANPFRQVSRVVQITTDQWNGVSTAGVTASWDGEAAEVSDDAPTLAQPSINVHKAQAFVPFSIEIGMDWPNHEADVRMMLIDAKDRLEGAAFATGAGDGSNQPTGIVTALDGSTSEIAPTTAETFAVADLYKVEEALGPRYRRTSDQAVWVGNKAIYNDVRQFGTADSHALWERLGAGQPPRLLGYRAYESSDMDGSINAAVTEDNFILVLGDFSNYVIVDRIGLQVELVPHLFATTNNRPSGQRGFYAWWRVGADSVNDAAFSMLSIPTTV